ncbi:sodium:proton antiporter [Acidaminobacter sp. JC074]|uniref:cation:proton antiporter n=1 Tax=Acidaminobacter sp. JC074 TaxID=2530199 RepID=UPI001F0E472B|nr:cation:proton antiporter [Acidaminobacter sp. JC074]MCH4889956.1 sodium:proton antiporter [Acidaminobacter sp. JC074]
MLLSLALILIIGYMLSGVFTRLNLPGFLGMIITGIVLGPHVLNLISRSILEISHELREIALVVILARAGLSLDLKDLRKVGRPAILMCFIPATFEIIAVVIFAPLLLGISVLEAAILGTVLAAVSPAVVVPKMIKLMESGYGKKHSIPQLIMAGSSVDDIFVIVLFTSFLGMYQGGHFDMMTLINVPISIGLGVGLGYVSGLVMSIVFDHLKVRDTVKILMILSVSFLFVSLETALKGLVPISGLLAVMTLGIAMLKHNETRGKRMAHRFSKVWVLAELLLFVLVGAAVDIRYVASAGLFALLLLVIELVFRMIGVQLCLIKTPLDIKERLFASVAYLPKATVQAAIGAMPLAAGVESGNTILAVAVLTILVTAPLGAIGIDKLTEPCLNKG